MNKIYFLFFLIAYNTNVFSQIIKLDDLITADSTKLVLLESNNEFILISQSILDSTKVDTLMKSSKMGKLMDFNLGTDDK